MGKYFLLTDKGRSALEELVNGVYSKGLNISEISRETKLTRDTLTNIFNHPDRRVQMAKLSTLFEVLNAKLEETHRAEHQPRRGEAAGDYEKRIEQFLRQVRIPFNEEIHCIEAIGTRDSLSVQSRPKRSQSTPLPTSPATAATRSPEVGPASACSPQQQLDTLLRSLNYKRGQATFEQSLDRLQPAGAFLLRVCDTQTQRWLVRRLAGRVDGFETGKKLNINVATLGGDFEDLWVQVAKALNLTSRMAETTLDRLNELCLASLIELCQEKTLIIVLSRVQQLDEAMQQRLVGEFWVPLVRKLCAQKRDWRSRLVLFLVQDGVGIETIQYPFEVVSPEAVQHPEQLVQLEPLLEIPLYETQGWFRRDAMPFLIEQIGESEAEKFMQKDQISGLGTYPSRTLENICNEFRIEMAELEPYWKLAG